jgi:predicted dehydrogenase
VWCEKPVALTVEELDAVEEAWRASGRNLAVGFNRRWSPAVQAARAALEGSAAPRMVIYRVAAGQVPAKHWYHDRRQGGRLLGEVCHFVDTAQALVGADIDAVSAVAGGRSSELLTSDDVALTLRFVDGSLAVIAYSSAATSAGKEHVEILAGDRRVVIDDFRSVEADGKAVWTGRQDKGHRAIAIAFKRVACDGDNASTEKSIYTTRWTLKAMENLSWTG